MKTLGQAKRREAKENAAHHFPSLLNIRRPHWLTIIAPLLVIAKTSGKHAIAHAENKYPLVSVKTAKLGSVRHEVTAATMVAEPLDPTRCLISPTIR